MDVLDPVTLIISGSVCSGVGYTTATRMAAVNVHMQTSPLTRPGLPLSTFGAGYCVKLVSALSADYTSGGPYLRELLVATGLVDRCPHLWVSTFCTMAPITGPTANDGGKTM